MPGDQSRTRPRTAAIVLGGAIILAGAGVLAWALPRALPFLPHAPASFWAVSLMALIVDAPLFVFTRSFAGPARTTLSVSFTFAILILWGAGPAVLVQAAATAVRALSQRLSLWQAALLGGRLLCALGAAEAVFAMLGGALPPPGDIAQAALAFLLPALTWAVVSFGLVVLGQVAVGLGTVDRATAALREDILGTTATLLLTFTLLPALDRFGWWTVLFLAPLLAWNRIARDIYGRQEVLRREPVTGVLTRRGLAASVEDLTVMHLLEGEGQRTYGVLLVNIDTAETINRDLGRDLYEALVAAAARRLVAAFGQEWVGRFAGEGFVVIRPDLSRGDAIDEAARAARILTPPFEADGILFRLNPTAGVALSPEHGQDLPSLVVRAELAMTQARRRAEPAQLYVAEAAAVLRRRRHLLTEFNAALRDPDRHAEITVRYQPQIELATGRLAGVEALVRWTDPQEGPVHTDELIAAIEPTDVMHRLTAHVIGRVAAQLAAWDRGGLPVRAAVNVSILDLYEEGFADGIGGALRRNGLPPDRLTVEITEGAVTSDADRVVRAAEAIGAMGVGLSLDDFGTGYASLQQLRLLPLTEVKIDRSYIAGMTTGRAERGIVRSVHQFTQDLGLALVAEGVEDAGTVAALARLPGVIGQGYYFGRPVPPEELARIALTRRRRAG